MQHLGWNPEQADNGRGRVQGNGGDICPTLTASASDCILRFEGYQDGKPLIRRLTEREIFRLMGVNDSDIDKIQEAGISSSQQYKMAGNSIVVDVLAGIFKNLILGCEKPEDYLF
jgi:DNA (cytosine-5)-methyltransferase 1